MSKTWPAPCNVYRLVNESIQHEDDAAGLAVASRMTAQIKGLNQAVQNAQHAVSMVEVAESAIVEISSMLMRMRELSVASQNGTNTTADRNAMKTEFHATTD